MFLNSFAAEDSWESFGQQGDQTANPTGNQHWIFIVKTADEVKALIFWPLDMKNQLIVKDSDTGKDWGQDEKGATEDEMDG